MSITLGAGVFVLVATALLGGPGFTQGGETSGRTDPGDPPSDILVQQGRALYVTGCQSCHGYDALGVRGVAPSLRGVGAQSADFYLSTGRMPLAAPDQEPIRKTPVYSPGQIAALVAYVGSFGGPAVPRIDLAGADISNGMQQFMLNCSGCHQALARGGVVTGASVPSLVDATPTQIEEAVRIGPYLMPAFGPRTIDARNLVDIASYVRSTRAPKNAGGWSLGDVGPIPEGMVAWMVGLLLLLVITRLIGERTEQ